MTWARSLEDAKSKIGTNKDISEEGRTKIVTEIDGEIARFHANMGH
jgi:hypothetical protein